MRVVQVIAGLHQDDGGPFQTLPKIWSHLADLKVEVKPFTTDVSEDIQELNKLSEGKYEVIAEPTRFPDAIRFSPELLKRLNVEMASADVCHNHGCWLFPNWAAAWASKKNRKPLVISPIGHLDQWSLRYHRWRKVAVRLLIEQRNLKYASAFIAKSQSEADQLKRLGFEQTIRVIPNGLDAAEWKRLPSQEIFLAQFPELRDKKLALFLSRIHQKKGIFPLLNAWKVICAKFPDWHLVIAGAETPYAQELKHWLENQPFKNRVSFVGELEGKMKKSAFSASTLFVLPSFSENFGQAILEALAAGLPVITTKGCPWEGIETNQCGWWIQMDEVNIRNALVEALQTSPSKLNEMGQRAKKWVLKEFSWEELMIQLRDLYREVMERPVP
jgi:glycosyltransferase involved in cell wall biosynthesis